MKILMYLMKTYKISLILFACFSLAIFNTIFSFWIGQDFPANSQSFFFQTTSYFIKLSLFSFIGRLLMNLPLTINKHTFFCIAGNTYTRQSIPSICSSLSFFLLSIGNTMTFYTVNCSHFKLKNLIFK